MKWCSCFLCGPAIYFRTGTGENPEYAKVKWHVHSIDGQLLHESFNALELYYGFIFEVCLPNSSRWASVDSKHFWAIPLLHAMNEAGAQAEHNWSVTR